MSTGFKKLLSYSVFAAAAALTCANTAFAAPHTMLPDTFQSHCDIRMLNLSSEQQHALKRIRTDFKQSSDRANRKAVRSEKNRRQAVIKILSSDTFDQNSARDYVENFYLSSMDFSVEELEIQHRFFHLLTPGQRQLWLSSCLK